jgi:hypothetical protein
MKSLLTKKKLVIPVVALLALAGAGAAVAATQSPAAPATPGSPVQAFIDDLAGRLGVTSSTLTTDIKAALDDQIDAAVTAGTLTQAEADALKQRIASGDGLPFLGVLGHGPGRGAGFGRPEIGIPRGGLIRAGLDVAAQYLGIDVATLRSDLESGKSLADVASSIAGKSTDGLRAALLAAAKTKLDQAVADGHLSSSQEQTILNGLSSHIDELLQRSRPGTAANGMGPFKRHLRGGHRLGLLFP